MSIKDFLYIKVGDFRGEILKSGQKENSGFSKTHCLLWLGNRDSNPNKQSQSLSCYRYTIPQNHNKNIIPDFRLLSRNF